MYLLVEMVVQGVAVVEEVEEVEEEVEGKEMVVAILKTVMAVVMRKCCCLKIESCWNSNIQTWCAVDQSSFSSWLTEKEHLQLYENIMFRIEITNKFYMIEIPQFIIN